MKRFTLKMIFTVLLTLALIGCGSNTTYTPDSVSKEDPITTSVNQSTEVNDIQEDGTKKTSTTIYSSGGSVTIDDVYTGTNGVYIENQDGTVTYTQGVTIKEETPDENGTEPEPETPDENGTEPEPENPEAEIEFLTEPDGLYNPSWSEKTCNSHGYFWCALGQQCLNEGIATGSCTRRGRITSAVELE